MSKEVRPFQLTKAKRPPVRGDWLQLLDVCPGDEHRITILSPSIEGWDCHWVPPRTRACTLASGFCPWCKEEKPTKTYWFLHVEHRDQGSQFALQLTDYAAEPLRAREIDRGTLRGLYCRVRRRTKNKRSPMVVTVLDQVPADRVRIPARPVEPTLYRLWDFPSALVQPESL